MRYLPALILTLAFAACSQDESAPVDNTVEEMTPGDTVAGDEQSLADPAPGSVTAPAAELIPAALQGRWGMTANDCDPGRSDAKGLMIVGANSLEFYESRGTLQEFAGSGAGEVRARFAYTGEGMEWETEETLSLLQDGAVLVRRSSGEDGAFGPFEYRRCA